MKILFVCRGNVGRSQIAEALFNQRVGSEHHAFSAGTWVKDKNGVSMHGTKLHEFEAAKEVVSSLREIDIEVGENIRTQIDEAMVDEADVVVVMAEEHTIPEFLKKSPKARHWQIEDPKGMNQEDTNKIRDQISMFVNELLSEIYSTNSRT